MLTKCDFPVFSMCEYSVFMVLPYCGKRNKKAIYNLGMVWTTMYHPFMVFYGDIGEGSWHWVYHMKIDENVQ